MNNELIELKDRQNNTLTKKLFIDDTGTPSKYNTYNTETIDEKLKDFLPKKIEKVSGDNYVQFNGCTVNNNEAYKIGNLVLLFYDIDASLQNGQNVVGKVRVKLQFNSSGASRISNGYNSFPATTIALSEGDFRIHASASGTGSNGTIILLLSDEQG